ncbi:hypothetical protein SDC49_21940 [Lactobacillus sp. R2/2]|nr:hypothetical protein [Lactobacillus sp. R2/2]
MDIDPNTVHVTYNSDDGTSTISGQVLHYKEKDDGVTSDGIFGLILPGGTKAYVKAVIKAPNGKETVWKPASWKQEKDDPYFYTNDSYRDPKNNILKQALDHEFAAEVKEDGTFEFTISKTDTENLKRVI